MKIQRILAPIMILTGSLLFTPQPAKADSFFFRFNPGPFLFSFYPYDSRYWPVYDHYYFSSPFYYNSLFHHFPLISYYHPVFYYPQVPYWYIYSGYSPLFYQYVYSYYRYRPYIYPRYYNYPHNINRYHDRNTIYYSPGKHHGIGNRSHIHITKNNKHHDHEKDIDTTHKHYYSDSDFRKNRNTEHGGKSEYKKNHGIQQQQKPEDIAQRLIDRNRKDEKRQKTVSPKVDRRLHDRRNDGFARSRDNRKQDGREVVYKQHRERDYQGNTGKELIANTGEEQESRRSLIDNFEKQIKHMHGNRDRENGSGKFRNGPSRHSLSNGPVRSFDRRADVSGNNRPAFKRQKSGKGNAPDRRRLQEINQRHY